MTFFWACVNRPLDVTPPPPSPGSTAAKAPLLSTAFSTPSRCVFVSRQPESPHLCDALVADLLMATADHHCAPGT